MMGELFTTKLSMEHELKSAKLNPALPITFFGIEKSCKYPFMQLRCQDTNSLHPLFKRFIFQSSIRAPTFIRNL